MLKNRNNGTKARNKAITRMYFSSPEITYAQVAAYFGGMTRQRVQQIVKREVTQDIDEYRELMQGVK